MLEWIYLIATIAGGTVLVCQFALALIGLGHDGVDMGHHAGGDFHADTHVGGTHSDHAGSAHSDQEHADSSDMFAIISFRTIVAAATFFGITGWATLKADFPPTTTLVLATLTGALAMYGMYRLLRLIAALSSAGNERIGNALGLVATVYVPIPATGNRTGKVQLSMQNRIVEYQAVTQDERPLKTGERVEIVGIVSDDTVVVRRVAPAEEKTPTAV
jgi:hypothetical protein